MRQIVKRPEPMYGVIRGIRWILVVALLATLIMVMFDGAIPYFIGTSINWPTTASCLAISVGLLVIGRYVHTAQIRIERRMKGNDRQRGFEVIREGEPSADFLTLNNRH